MQENSPPQSSSYVGGYWHHRPDLADGGGGGGLFTKIDWIFSRAALPAIGAENIRTHNKGRHPGDHYFVTTEVELLV